MEDKIIQWLKNNFVSALIVLSVFLIIAYKTFEKTMDRIEVRKEYNVTTGKIIDYNVLQDGPSIHLTYEYTVNGRTFTRLINGPKKHFNECEDNIEHCSDKRFLVIYSKNYPNKSLINLTKEIQGHITVPNNIVKTCFLYPVTFCGRRDTVILLTPDTMCIGNHK